MAFFVWVISLNIIPSTSIHVVANPFLSVAEYSIYIYMYVKHFFIHSSIDGHLGCFHILAIVNNDTVNIRVHLPFWISVFVFFAYIPRSGIAGSYMVVLVFRETAVLFSTVAVPTNSVLGFPFLYTLVSICYLCSFWW